MKIAIIGGGWVGCHLSYKLKNDHDVTIFEKNKNLFQETSYNNQNRLHLGYHYPRSHKTRELCNTTFHKFLSDYNFLITDVTPNVYCISNKNSIIDFKTYTKIFDDYSFENLDIDNYNLKNIEGCIVTEEKHINFKLAYEFFNKELKDITIKKTIDKSELIKLKNGYDLVINCTNNHINDTNINDYFYELTLTLIYKKNSASKFGSLTVMDGKFVSLYPYHDDLYTLTDVENTPIEIFNDVEKLIEFKKNINLSLINDKKLLFEKNISFFYPEFYENFIFHTFFLSTKTKIISNTDNRYPIISETDNLVNCFTGKIQGIYIIEDFINNKLCRMIN